MLTVILVTGLVLLLSTIVIMFKKMKMLRLSDDSLKVTTNCGNVRGTRMRGEGSNSILSFRGIPYAKPPVGDSRFKRSELIETWDGLVEGRKEAKKSLQPNVLFPEHHFLSEGSEDCLYLNVYTKTTDQKANQPVIVFLHGGAFVVGSCESVLYGPEILLEEDVVLVGVNYRLGILGWLSLETQEAPGNLGLHDQLLALQWVHKNIRAFGGDPDRVTLMGESAGSMSALLHLVSPASKGLFHRVMALSGTPSSVFLHRDRRPRRYALEVAKELGCSNLDDMNQVLLFLQSLKAKDILRVSTLFIDWDYANPMPWTPCIDTHSDSPLVPRTFHEAVECGHAADVPVIAGSCRDEGLILSAKFFRDPSRWNLLRKEWKIWSPLILFNKERDEYTESDIADVEAIREHYFGDDVLEDMDYTHENILKLTEMCTMSWFLAPMDSDVQLLVNNGIKVYTFVLTVPPNFTLFDLFRLSLQDVVKMFVQRNFYGSSSVDKVFGVSHSDDLLYLFPMAIPGFPPCVVTPLQKLTQKRLLDMVYTFSDSGKPEIEGCDWPHVLEGDEAYFEIGPQPQMISNDRFLRQLSFWRQIHERRRSNKRQPSDKPFPVLHNKIAIHRSQQIL